MTEPGRDKLLVAARKMLRFALALILLPAVFESASAQGPHGLYSPGDAAVTGFSGAIRPFEIKPGQDPDPLTLIDPEGSSLRVLDLTRMGGPPEGQLVGAPKRLTISAKLIGQVFGVALDDQSPANIYVAATSAYGLAIVAPGPDGQPQHIRFGENGATFMPAQWGPGGGPGSIWKISGSTGDVKLFANVATGGRANSGAALGGLAYDSDTKSLFVSDRESGLIHRFGPNGVDLGVYDHGVAGASAVGLAPAPARAGPGADIGSPQFDSAQPETWGYAAPQRRVFGLAVHDHRLYYAVAEGLRVWSVGLNPDGSFGPDPRIELAAPPAAGRTEISRITFDDQGRMYLAERPAPTGAQDFRALSVPSIGRVLRYATIGATETKRPIWRPAPDEYAVGFAGQFRNANGGVAIGYSYDTNGNLDPRACGGFLWMTGEQLRHAAELDLKDAPGIDGLQGNPIWRIRRHDEPPRFAYFIDETDTPPDLSARGHMGDIAILRACREQAAKLFFDAPPALTPPAAAVAKPSFRTCQTHVCGAPAGPVCALNQVWSIAAGACKTDCLPPETLVNGKCCAPKDLALGGACSGGGPSTGGGGPSSGGGWPSDGGGGPSTEIAKPSCGVNQTAIGPKHDCCDNANVYSGPNGAQLCCQSPLVNGKCEPQLHKPPLLQCANCCSPGYVAINGACCLKGQATSTGQCCPPGQSPGPDGTKCLPTLWLPKITMCCAAGYIPSGNGKCCAAANLTTNGTCCPTPVNPKDRRQCSTETVKKGALPAPCSPGEVRGRKGACAPAGRQGPPVTRVIPLLPGRLKKCGRNERRNETGACVQRNAPAVTPLSPVHPKKCRRNERRDETGACVARGRHPPRLEHPEPPEQVLQRPLVCPPGFVPGPLGRRCWPVAPRRVGPPTLDTGPGIFGPQGPRRSPPAGVFLPQRGR